MLLKAMKKRLSGTAEPLNKGMRGQYNLSRMYYGGDGVAKKLLSGSLKLQSKIMALLSFFSA